ncbi:RHS repeat protein [Nitrogeniibacter mangrovi]|uniref:RHS repeat protein n=1 Tax=Nitrogeniibacter mangrovi TaxID=2016596 RepID=A0A6C1B6S6_9RHOO|nr:RHS repeat-associated core domain-containing protein [Nitrogeniibacter mangrovi]QID19401.1 RHS repeat protein [Nitrogeniibacter mangrovi]
MTFRRKLMTMALSMALLPMAANAALELQFDRAPAARNAAAGPRATQPGINRAVFSIATSEEDARAAKIRERENGKKQAANGTSIVVVEPTYQALRASGDNAPVGPGSIAELARALKGDPDLIYEYVRNNVEFYPIWGVQKGAVGAILDNQGTAFDQAELMVELLRQSGYTASYVKGRINLTAAQVQEWYGVDVSNTCGVANLLGNGQIPVSAIYIAAPGSCPSSPPPLHSVKIDHVWVKVNIGGTDYVFDPSYKPHTQKAAIDLASASGYNASTYLSSAKSGATVTTDYVQDINRTNIRSNLTTYANNLATYLRANKPVADLDDVIGGKIIMPHDGSQVRQTTLPYQDTSVTPTVWTGDVPASYKPTLRVRYAGIDQTYASDAIYGKRLSITYNGSNQPVLKLDGVTQATGSAVTPGSVGTVTFNVVHPYAQTYANQNFTQQIKAGGTFVIGNAWGSSGRGVVEHHHALLADAKASGNADDSEVVLGSSLAVLSSAWIAQTNHSDYITDRLAKTNTLFHHQVGIAGYNTAPYVDLPGNMLSVVSEEADAGKESAVFFSSTMRSSIFESTAVQQTADVSAVSTVKLVDIAAAAGDKIYDARSTNYTSVVQPALVSCSPWLTNFQNAINAGHRLILPTRCNLSEGSWSGAGYFDIYVGSSSSSIGAIIGGGLAGGFSTTTWSAGQTSNQSLENSYSPTLLEYGTDTHYGDPIDVAKGYYLYAREDMLSGLGAFPYSLGFERIYSSGLRTISGPLGRGWTHNFASSVKIGHDGFQGMGEDSALDAVGSIVEHMVALDLLSDTAKPIDKMVIATLGQRWFGDQLLNNTVIVKQGLNGEVFVKLPDGSYNPPPGNSAKLIKNVDGTYSYETAYKAKLNFDSTGKVATYVHPSGVQVKFTYSGNDLTKVENSLGRVLNITNVSGRVTQVGDGSHTIQYAYDANGNLVTFTDALSEDTTFSYDQPGRLSQVFYPTRPTTPFLTNVFDSLGRVQSQTNANGQTYTYYFAGSRSEEVAPDGESKVSYLDALGKVIKTVDELGRVTTNTYDAQSRLIKTVLPEGNSVEYAYDDAPCAAQSRCTHNVKTIKQIAKPGSGLATLTSSFTYESGFNKVATATDQRGNTTTYTYTAQGNPLTVTSPADSSGVQPTTTYGYTSFTPSGFPAFYLQTSQTTKTSSSNSVVTNSTYLAANKYVPQTTVLDSGSGKLNLTTTYTYDAVGNLTVVNGPRTDVTDTVTNTYDAERRLVTSTDALGKATVRAYDAEGRLVRSSAQIGTQWLVTCVSYTPTGKVSRRWGPAQTASSSTCPSAAAPVKVTDYTYNNRDWVSRVTENLTTAEGGDRLTDTSYFADGSVATVERAVGTGLAQTYAAYTYTDNGLVKSLEDANGNLTTYEYDGHDRKIKTRYPDKVTAGVSSSTDYEQYGYDAVSNLTSLRKRNGQSVTLAYDNLNRLISRTYPTSADNVSFAYDLVGRRTAANMTGGSYAVSYQWDNAGRLVSTTAGGKTLSYQYDAAGNRTRTTWPEASTFYVTTAFDALNRPTAIKEMGTTNLATYAYDDLSRRTTVTLGNGTTTTLGYNAQGVLASLAHDLTGTTADVTYTYTRNQTQELTKQIWSNNVYQWSGASNGTQAYSSNGLNQYTNVAGSSIAYDPNGNLSGDGVWSYGYDLDNRLKSASKTGYTASLAYDAEGRLRQTTLAGMVTNLLYDGVEVLAEYNASGTLLRRYVHGPGVDEPIVWYEGSGTISKTWFYTDHLGSVVGQADASGSNTATYSYGPFGEPNTTTGTRFRYTGQQYLSGLNLYYYKARFYSPAIGRFLQTDPIGYRDDLNIYAYVGNSPIGMNDPTGLAANPVATFIRQSAKYLGVKAAGASLRAAKQRAVAAAWKMERQLVDKTGKGTRSWTRAQREELLETGKVKGFHGDHINSASGSPTMAGNPDNIQFLTEAEHIARHQAAGGTQVPVYGEIVDRTAGGTLPRLADRSGYSIKGAALGAAAATLSGVASAAEVAGDVMDAISPFGIFHSEGLK